MDYLFGLAYELLGLGVLVLIVLFIVRRRGNRQEKHLSSKNKLLFAVAGITYMMMYFGAGNLLRIGVELASGTSTTYAWSTVSTANCSSVAYTYPPTCDYQTGNATQTRTEVAAWTALIIVGLPIFAYCWIAINKLLSTGSGEELEADKEARRQLGVFYTWAAVLVELVVLVWFVYQVLLLILGVSSAKLSDFSTPVAFMAASAATLVFFHENLKLPFMPSPAKELSNNSEAVEETGKSQEKDRSEDPVENPDK